MRIEKDQHEGFATFFAQPTREHLREMLRTSVGEADHLDFKGSWPDLEKIAKHVISIANSGGGAIVVGVEQTSDGHLLPSGLTSLLDKTHVAAGLQRFLPKTLKYFLLDFHYQAAEYTELVGKAFQVLLVEDDPKGLPYLSLADGAGIRRAAVYVRFGSSSREADHDELQRLLNRRVETGYSSQGALDLAKHLEQLRELDERRPGNDCWLHRAIEDSQGKFDDERSSDYMEFLEELYEAKKSQVWRELGLPPD